MKRLSWIIPLILFWVGTTRAARDITMGYTSVGATTHLGVGQDATANTGEATSELYRIAKGGDVVDSVYVYAACYATASQTILVALYTQPNTEPHRWWKSGAPLDTVRITIADTLGWYGAEVSWVLANGWRYCLAVGGGPNDSISLRYQDAGTQDAEQSTSMTNPWTAGTDYARKYSFYGTIDTAAFQAMIGDSTYVNNNVVLAGPYPHAAWSMKESKTYTAIAGDYVAKFSALAEYADTIEFALYTYNTSTDVPENCVYRDTLITGGVGPAWYSITGLNVSLSAGTTYTLGMAFLDSLTGGSARMKRLDWTGQSDSSNAWMEDGGVSAECPYNATGNSGLTAHSNIAYFAIIANSGGSCPTVTHNSPTNGGTVTSLPAHLIWDANDADGDSVVYSIYGDQSNPPTTFKFSDTLDTPIEDNDYTWTGLSDNQTYYWRVRVTDGVCTTTHAVWTFTTDTSTAVTAGRTVIGPSR